MGIEEQIDRLIDLGEDIKGRLDRLVELASDHFAGANKMVAKEPPKKWRILEPGESVRASDWENEDLNSETDPPDGPGWRPASMWKNGRSVLKDGKCIYARPVAEEPAKELEHPAGPMPDPGKGYRILSKEPPEDLTPGDEFEDVKGEWIRSSNAETDKKQGATCWYRRKIEPAEPPEPEYREPVLPGDCGKRCEFSDDLISWEGDDLIGWRANLNTFNWESASDSYRYARIKVDA